MTLVDVTGRPLIRTVVREQRAPAAATQRTAYTGVGNTQTYTWNAANSVRFQYLANVVVYRCVKLIAQTVASLPFRTGIAPPARPGLTADHNPQSQLARFLGPPPGGPAPKLTARRLWAWTVTQRLVTGRNAWEIELATGTKSIVALWPLVSAMLDPIPSSGGTEWFTGFAYNYRTDKPKLLPAERVHYGWDPSPEDFRQAESPLQAAKLPVELARMMDTYNVSFLKNDARPAGIVVTEAFGTDEEFQQFKREFDDLHGGPNNAGRALIVESEGGEAGVAGSIHYQALGITQKDALFVEQHKAALEQITVALGVPWSLLDASGRTFDNASEETEHFWVNTIIPLCENLADEVNLDLAPRLGGEIGWFDFSGVRVLRSRPEPVTQAVGANVLVQSQLMWINEARADYGLDPLPDGDRMLTADEIAALGRPADPTQRSLPAPPEQRTPEPPAPTPPAPVEQRTPTPEQIEERRARIWRTTDAVVTTIENRWNRAFTRFFDRQERATISRLEGKRGRQLVRAPGDAHDVDSIFDPTFWRTETRELASDLYELAVAAGQTRVSDLFSISFDLTDEWVASFIDNRANQLAGQVTDTTYRAIQQALVDGAGEGDSIPQLADRVREVFAQASKNRATVIARTEVISAYNGSVVASASTLPADVAAGQEWIATRDGRTRAAHGAADGQVVPLGSPFTVGGDALAYPGDPNGRSGNTIQCRCAVAILTPDEYAAATADRTVPVGLARAVLSMMRRDTPDDRLRAALQEAA